MASDNAMALAPQLGPLVLKMAGHARSVTLAQAARQTPKVLPELLRGNAEMHAVMLWVNQGGSVDACDEDGVSLLMRQVNQGKLPNPISLSLTLTLAPTPTPTLTLSLTPILARTLALPLSSPPTYR